MGPFPTKILTIDFELNDFADTVADPVGGLAQIKALPVLLHVLQQQGTVTQQSGVDPFSDLFVLAGLACYRNNIDVSLKHCRVCVVGYSSKMDRLLESNLDIHFN